MVRLGGGRSFDRQVDQVHRDEGLGQARIGAGDVAEIRPVRPQLAVDGGDAPGREVVDVEDVAEARVLEIEILGDHRRTGQQRAGDLVPIVDQLPAEDAVGRIGVERPEKRIGTFNARHECVVAAVLVEQKRRLVLGRLWGQRASQGGVVDALGSKDVEQIAVEVLDFPKGLRASIGHAYRCHGRYVLCGIA